jgi:hypothetical protein
VISWLPTPYGLWETLALVGRMGLGPSRSNRAAVTCLPHEACLNPIVPAVRIAFVGDIMVLSAALLGQRRTLRRTRYRLVFEEELRRLLSGCDVLIGNFEGAFADRRRSVIDQAHDPGIIAELGALFEPARTYLSLGNNHAGDFGQAVLDRTVGLLEEAGFTPFGLAARPVATIWPGVEVVGGTAWSNRPCDGVARLDDVVSRAAAEHASILFPHWGHELEACPRPELVALAKRLIDRFVAIVGHHSHTPQPVTALATAAGATRPVAYSLGNFCFGTASRHYQLGELLVLELGPTAGGPWATGRLRWSFLRNRHVGDEVRVGPCDTAPQLDFAAASPHAEP